MKDFFARLSMQSNGVGIDVQPLTPSLFAPLATPAPDDQPPCYHSQAPLIGVAPTVTDLVDSPAQMTNLELPPELVPEHVRQLALPHTFLHPIASIPVTARMPVETDTSGEVEEVVGMELAPTLDRADPYLPVPNTHRSLEVVPMGLAPTMATKQEGMSSQTTQHALQEASQQPADIVPLHEGGPKQINVGKDEVTKHDHVIGVGIVPALPTGQDRDDNQVTQFALHQPSLDLTDTVPLNESRPRTPIGNNPHQPNISANEVTKLNHVVGARIVPVPPMVQESSLDLTDIVPLHESRPIAPAGNKSYQPNISANEVTKHNHVVEAGIVPALPTGQGEDHNQIAQFALRQPSLDLTNTASLHESRQIASARNKPNQINVGKNEETRRDDVVEAGFASALLTAQERDGSLVPPPPTKSQENADIRLIRARPVQGKVPTEHSASMRTETTNVAIPSLGRQSAPSVIMPLLIVQPEVSVQVGKNAFSREEKNVQAQTTATRSTARTQVVKRGQSIQAHEQPITNKKADIGQQSIDQEPQLRIQVRIGHIDVRATPPASPPPRQRAGMPKPTLTLSEYLQQRKAELQ